MGREGCGWGGFLLSGWVTLRKLSLLKKTSVQTRSWSKVLGLIKESIPFTKSQCHARRMLCKRVAGNRRGLKGAIV